MPGGLALSSVTVPTAAVALTLAEIVARLGGTARGDASRRIARVCPLQEAAADGIAFLADSRYRQHLATTAAGAVILVPELVEALPANVAAILTPQPYLYYARVTALLYPPVPAPAGIHPAASVSSTIPASVHVGAGAQIAANVTLGERVEIRAGAVVGEGVVIGADSVLHPGAVIYPGCRIGARAILHSGAVIGADGFGFAPDFGADGSGRWVKIPQIGGVVIGDDVEIGANTSIDRGALADTVIEDGVKLDNQIQIGHNCVIGAHTVIAGCVGIAGSAKIGHHCRIGGAAMILGHLSIAPETEISPGSMVMTSITAPGGKFTALYPLLPHRDWQKSAAHLRRLDELARRVANLERQLSEQQTTRK
ncbi:MAG: UDP-3-O-(3-hydroxymyristoyl)glucosamine N-acyltransferase [Zoogloeaceae bacterium]|jgi:UDP-3-O-[3-hydroxymyristoyl] glucosamine N-acyltransferase|nr:UDP-3-O-(3-hydroxymyristoyl)glucosamine N-acyltransferase [Zoogloeaceae bacterium]